MKCRKYDDVHSELIEEKNYVEIFGLNLEPNDYQADSERWKRFFPIIWCYCVHDSPGSPCPCTGPIVWLRRDDVLSSSVLLRQSDEGDEIMRFKVARDAWVVVENASRVSILELISRKTTQEKKNCGCGKAEWNEETIPHFRFGGKCTEYLEEGTGLLHNKFLETVYTFLDANPNALKIELLRNKESIIISNYYDLPFEEFLCKYETSKEISKRESEIILSLVDQFFGRLNRLARKNYRRNFINSDLILFTDFQRTMLAKQRDILLNARGIDEVKRGISVLRDKIVEETNYHQAIPLLVSSNIAIESYKYWDNKENMSKWNELLRRMLPITGHSKPSAGPVADADGVGGAIGAFGACLGCGYYGGWTGCNGCVGPGGALVGGGASLVAAFGCHYFTCDDE